MRVRYAKLVALFLSALASVFVPAFAAPALQAQSVEFAMINDFPLGSYRELSAYNVGWQSRLNLDYAPDPRFGAFFELGNAYWTDTPSYVDSGTQIGLTAGARVLFPVATLGDFGTLRLGGDFGYGLLSHLTTGSWTGDEAFSSYFDQALIVDGEVSLSLSRLPFDPFLTMRYLFSPGQSSSTHELGLHVGARYRLRDKALFASYARPRPKSPTKLAFASPRVELFLGEPLAVYARPSPSDADDTSLLWSSDDASIASVDDNGLVTGLKCGETRVRVQAFPSKGVAAASSGRGAEGPAAIGASLIVRVMRYPEDVVAGLSPAFAPGDSADSVSESLVLAATAEDGLAILWSSDEPGVVAADGTVSRPPYGSGDKGVSLTATVKRADKVSSRVYALKVKETPPSKAETVSAIAQSLDLAIPEVAADGSLPTSLSLATEGGDGTKIEWFSSRPDLVSSAGEVHRPPFGSGDTEVVLTAIVFKGGASEVKKMTILVKELPQTDEEAVRSDAEALMAHIAPGKMPLLLQSSVDLPREGKYGSSISWVSSRPDILSAEGSLSRPLDSGAFVSLVATLERGGASTTARFLFDVEARADDGAAKAAE